MGKELRGTEGTRGNLLCQPGPKHAYSFGPDGWLFQVDGVTGIGDETELGLGELGGHLPGNGDKFAVQFTCQKQNGQVELGQLFPERGLYPGSHAAQAVG